MTRQLEVREAHMTGLVGEVAIGETVGMVGNGWDPNNLAVGHGFVSADLDGDVEGAPVGSGNDG